MGVWTRDLKFHGHSKNGVDKVGPSWPACSTVSFEFYIPVQVERNLSLMFKLGAGDIGLSVRV